MKYLFIVLTTFLFVFADIEMAWAQTQPTVQTNTKPLAKWLFSATETKLVFDDGREASLLIALRKKVVVQTKAQFIENSCFPELLPKDCFWDYEVGAYDLSFVWSKNPDAAKLNQVVSVKTSASSSDSGMKLLTTMNDLSTSRSLLGSESEQAKQRLIPTLTCDTDNWTLNFPKSEKQNVLIPVWTFEFMTQNPISKKNENLSFAQINDIELISIGKNKWKLLIPESSTELEKLIPVLDPNTLYYEKDNNECSVQIRIEKSAIATSGLADGQPIEKTYSLPLTKGIPKNIVNREVFRGAQQLTREQGYGSTIKAE